MLALVMTLAPVSTSAGRFALRCGKGGLHAVIAHAVRVLDHQAGDHAFLEEARPAFSSLSKPITLILSPSLFSAIAWPAPCAMIRLRGEDAAQVRVGGDQVGHDVEAGGRLAVGNLSATSLSPGYLAAICSMKPWRAGRANRRPAGWRDHGDFALVLAVFLVIAAARPSAAIRPPWMLSVVRNEVNALRVGGGVDADDLDRLGSFVDRLAERLELVGEITTAAGLPATAFSRMPIWPLMSDSDCAPSSGTLTPRSLPACAGAGQNDLPVEGRRVLDDDRDGRAALRLCGGMGKGERQRKTCGGQQTSHVLPP